MINCLGHRNLGLAAKRQSRSPRRYPENQRLFPATGDPVVHKKCIVSPPKLKIISRSRLSLALSFAKGGTSRESELFPSTGELVVHKKCFSLPLKSKIISCPSKSPVYVLNSGKQAQSSQSPTLCLSVPAGDETGEYYIIIAGLPWNISWQKLKDFARAQQSDGSYIEIDHVMIYPQNQTNGWVRVKGKENFLRAFGMAPHLRENLC